MSVAMMLNDVEEKENMYREEQDCSQEIYIYDPRRRRSIYSSDEIPDALEA